MKKLILTCLIVIVFSQANCFAWEWESYGPEGIKANKLCFFEWNSISAVACVDTGMYILSGYGGISYDYYSYCQYGGSRSSIGRVWIRFRFYLAYHERWQLVRWNLFISRRIR